MKKQSLIVSALLLMILTPIFSSSEIGFSASLNSSTVLTDTDYYSERSTSNVLGYSLVMPYQYNFNEKASIRAEITYITKNYTEDTYQSYDESTTQEFHYNSYFELPIMGRYYFKKVDDFRPFINLGGYFSYWLTASTEGEYLNLSSITGVDSSDDVYTTIETEGFSSNDNRYNWGLLGGIGFEFQLEEHFKLAFETRITQDITSLYKTDQIQAVDEFNQSIETNFGFMYSF
jgi:outer membrane protein W